MQKFSLDSTVQKMYFLCSAWNLYGAGEAPLLIQIPLIWYQNMFSQRNGFVKLCIRWILNCFDVQWKVGRIHFLSEFCILDLFQTWGNASWYFKTVPHRQQSCWPKCTLDMTILLKQASLFQNVNLLNKSQIPRSKVWSFNILCHHHLQHHEHFHHHRNHHRS